MDIFDFKNHLLLLSVVLAIYITIVSIQRWWCNRTIQINCWFCGEDSHIQKCSSKWWYCLHCEQYNGFDDDGDYNETIPDMFTFDTQKRFCTPDTGNQHDRKKNLLCNSCQQKQTHKMKEISNFQSSNEALFDQEYSVFRQTLEWKYNLCLSCRTATMYHLQQQDHQIKRTHSNNNVNMDHTARKLITTSSISVSKRCQKLVVMGRILSIITSGWLSYEFENLPQNMLYVIMLSLLLENMATFYTSRQIEGWSLMSFLLWIFLWQYGNYRTKSSHQVRTHTLTVILAFDSSVLMHMFFKIFVDVRKQQNYLKGRKSKVEQARNSPKFKSRLSSPSEFQDESQLPTKDQESINEVNNVTPDLLNGHLDAMFIARNLNKEQGKENKITNHVVAALKYTPKQPLSTTIDITRSRPLIRPATLVWTSENSTLLLQNDKNKSPIAFDVKNEEIKEDNVAVKQNTGVINSLNSVPMQEDQVAAKPKVVNHGMRYLSWTSLLITGLVLSVTSNIYFVLRS